MLVRFWNGTILTCKGGDDGGVDNGMRGRRKCRRKSSRKMITRVKRVGYFVCSWKLVVLSQEIENLLGSVLK